MVPTTPAVFERPAQRTRRDVFNYMLILPVAGIAFILWGLVKRSKPALWAGAGLVVLFALLGLLDRFLGC